MPRLDLTDLFGQCVEARCAAGVVPRNEREKECKHVNTRRGADMANCEQGSSSNKVVAQGTVQKRSGDGTWF